MSNHFYNIRINEPNESEKIIICASAWVPDPETEEQMTARLIREKRIGELLAELENLGWNPADYDLDYI